PEDRPGRVRPGAQRADHVDRPAVGTATRDGGHVRAEGRLERAGDRVAVEDRVEVFLGAGALVHHVLLIAQVPLGPNRSVRTRSGGSPSVTSPFAAVSTRAVGPQM